MSLDFVLRWVPRHHWVRLFLTTSRDRDVERGHDWMYEGIIRRDAWRIGHLGFGIMRMPRRDIKDGAS